MTAKTLLLGACASLALASVVQAQPAPAARPAAAAPAPAAAAPAAPPIQSGPPISGLCMVSVEGAIGNSTVGKFFIARMRQLGQQVDAELQPEQTAIQTEARNNEAARATTDPAIMQTRDANLQLRYTNFQRKAELRQRELQATAEKAQGRIAQELDPVLTVVYQAQHCSLLLRREAVIFGNPAMDVTQQAVTGLNARIQQFQFDREHLDTAAPGAPAAPPAPR